MYFYKNSSIANNLVSYNNFIIYSLLSFTAYCPQIPVYRLQLFLI
ncbi:hypothetical protein EMIT019CA3_10821 [Bacillus pseudomycoides]